MFGPLRHFIVLTLCVPGLLWAQEPEPKPADPVQKKLDDAGAEFYGAIQAAHSAYRDRLAEMLAGVDKATIYLLDGKSEVVDHDSLFWYNHVGDGYFPIVPEGGRSHIMKQRQLSAKEIARTIAAMGELLKSDLGSGAMCHLPIHGLRLWKGGHLVFESSFCWRCGNFYVRYPNEGADWLGTTRAMAELMTELMPIPASKLGQVAKAPLAPPAPFEERLTDSDLSDAKVSYLTALQAADSRFRDFVTKYLPAANKIEVLLLDSDAKPDAGAPPADFFPDDTRRDRSHILTRRLLKPPEIKKLLPLFEAAIDDNDESAMAAFHFPVHGLRIWKDDTLLFEGSLCWPANNFIFSYPDGRRGLRRTTSELEHALKEFLPVPPPMLEQLEKKLAHPPAPFGEQSNER